MTDGPKGHGWWQASDLKWYPPEQRPDYMATLPPPPTADAAQQQSADSTLAATPTPEQPQKPAKTRQVIERDKLGVLTKIGQGGQGVVYRAPNVKTKFAASMVYKEYKPQARNEIDFTALAAMPALVEESLTYAQAERLISIAAWPCALVENAGSSAGFVMPAIPDEFFISLSTAKGVSSSAAEFQHLLNHSSILDARGIAIDDAQRYTLLRETASALVFLHKHGVCAGDISPKNVLFSLTPHEAVYFIDCDAMRINTVSALPQVETPGWQAPAGEELATIYTDTYKLGLLALRLVTGDQDTTNPQHILTDTPTQLRQIITDTLTKPPHQRPLPAAWTSVLGNAIEQAQHQAKTTSPVNAAPAPPSIPVVHSRPSGGPSAPPVAPPRPDSRPPEQSLRPAERPPVPQPRPAQQSPSEIGTPPTPSEKRPRRRLTWALVAAIVVIVAAGVGAIVITNHHKNSNGAQHAEPGSQVTLPFTGLSFGAQAPTGVAVDAAGDLYVTDVENHRVLKLAAGSTSQQVLPFTGLRYPIGVAVDAAGDLYVTDRVPDGSNDRVLELAAGSAAQSVVPFTGLYGVQGVAVDAAGDLYVVDAGNNRVLELPAGSTTQSVLPFTGLQSPTCVAVDAAGNLYVTAGSGRIVKLAAGSATQSVLPFTGLNGAVGVAVDAGGDLYVTDTFNGRVVKLAAGSAAQSVVPFTGLKYPSGVAVDGAGNLYVTDLENSRVVKLAAG